MGKRKSQTESLNDWMTGIVSRVAFSDIADLIYLIILNILFLENGGSSLTIACLWGIPRIAVLFAEAQTETALWYIPQSLQFIGVQCLRAGFLVAIPFAMSNLFWVYVILLLLGICSATFSVLFSPVQTMFIPRKCLKQDIGLIRAVKYNVMIVGTIVAGFLLVYGHFAALLWMDAATFLASAVLFSPILNLAVMTKIHPVQVNSPSRYFTDWRRVFDSFKKKRLFIKLFTLYSIVSMFVLSVSTQGIFFAKQVLHLTHPVYGLVEGVLIIFLCFGLKIGSLVSTVITKRLQTEWVLSLGSLMNACGFFIFSFSHNYWQDALGLTILGIFSTTLRKCFTVYMRNLISESNMRLLYRMIGPLKELMIITFIFVDGAVAALFGERSLFIAVTVAICTISLLITVLVFLPHNRRKIKKPFPGVLVKL